MDTVLSFVVVLGLLAAGLDARGEEQYIMKNKIQTHTLNENYC